jgi:hypothetical protein
MNVFIFYKTMPQYETRMEAITAYTWAAYELGTELALMPKEGTKGQKVSHDVTNNVPFRCFPA